MTDGMPAKKSSIKKKLVFGVGLFMLVSATCVAIVMYFRSQNLAMSNSNNLRRATETIPTKSNKPLS